MRRLTLITLSVLLLATIAGAQATEQSWDNLKSLQVGQKIQVVNQRLKSQNGTFVSVSEEAIIFQTGKDAVTIQRADVFRVSSQKGMGRGEHALIGLAIGAAAGAVIGGIGGSSLEGGGGAAPFAVLVGGMGAGIGAGIGAALPAGHPTIYRAERRKDQTAP
ncbi:MAG: hypothetical protein A3G20_03135 [Acidobacteria bacterium RIFCSPLOWO2_12_FULL_59_11]|nr:MAG: hypothetical protein A3G20_03135 [Acidobacteria bacterium RIFCSPLOWO2_12_FULL_59_11]